MDRLVATAEPAIVPVPEGMEGAEGSEPYPVPSVTRHVMKFSASGSVTTREIRREQSIVEAVRRFRYPAGGSVHWFLSASVRVRLSYAVHELPADPGEQLEGRQVHLECSLRGLPDAARESLVDVAARFADEHDLIYGQIGEPMTPGSGTMLEDHLPMALGPRQAWRRHALRGYDWLTLVRPDLWEQLDEAHRKYARASLFSVGELPHGLVRLQATERPEDYDELAVRRVFEALSPLLPAQAPEPMPWFLPGHAPPPPPMLIFEEPQQRLPHA
ncbi:hypothetical protein [Terrabacter sp. MAHUQ-38]|uniref:hypothetical protein n=1 Tax=unclassified Terrabacter TaxID=2630222 RepID=UPI00165E5167|nr:hypothetical protein [Terrabacter sp. MAHUQ-38]MBC9821140.1 hypothetical protein [Terrabacter sp. MAHUQ-38]